TPDLSYSLLAEGGLAVAAGALFVASDAGSTLPPPPRPQPRNGPPLHRVAPPNGRAPLIARNAEPPLPPHARAPHRGRPPRPARRSSGGRRGAPACGAGACPGPDGRGVLPGGPRRRAGGLPPPRHRPTSLAEGLPGLLGPHPEVTVTGAAAACGGWRAAVHGG